MLKGAGDVDRMSKDAVNLAREMAHLYLEKLGAAAADAAKQAGRKTIMPPDLHAGQRTMMGGAASTPASSPASGESPSVM
ncbi:MAG: histone-like protein [Candidatus Hydrogenedentota bacterium]